MANNAFPSMIWHLWDYDHTPGGSYFGAKKALCSGELGCVGAVESREAPKAHIVLLPTSGRMVAVNHNAAQASAAMTLNASIYSLVSGTLLESVTVAVEPLPADGTEAVGEISAQLARACHTAGSASHNVTVLARLTTVTVRK